MENIIQLIEGCKKQLAKSQKILYEQFYGYTLKIAFRYVHRYDIAINVTNDGFVKIFHNIEKFRCEEHEFPERLFMAWMKRIIINTSIDEMRKNNVTPEIGGIPEYVWEERNHSQKADEFLLYKEMISYVKDLPPKYRIVFNMFVIDGFSHFDIANTLGISVGTSKSNLFRARDILQKIIREKEEARSWII